MNMLDKRHCKTMQETDTVGAIIQGRSYLSFYPDEKIETIVREMQTHHQGAVAIIDAAGKCIGLLTERDILRKIFGFYGETAAEYDTRHHNLSRFPEELTAWEVLFPDPVSLRTDMTIEDALDIIRQKGFRYMPVMSADTPQRLVGIVSERELYWRAQDAYRREIAQKNNLLSYFMHHESYGLAAHEV